MPSGCGGSGWGAITNVGDGLKVGLASAALTGGVAVVMGGHTEYGWMRVGTVPPYVALHACSTNHPKLGVPLGASTPGGTVLATGFADTTAFTLVDAGSGTYNIKPSYGPGTSCLTDNGANRQLTIGDCVPGAKSQLWRVP
ncbi:hypothetical protein [Kitasatospora sp. NPDC051914]|uniref:hypothetical protein n=1 Tax=Kitasatospora sp. NPDC051914 TaxID=3154945 RepID=UPI0034134657